jgi:hypothetical protein
MTTFKSHTGILCGLPFQTKFKASSVTGIILALRLNPYIGQKCVDVDQAALIVWSDIDVYKQKTVGCLS